jgi:hypothetical protein
MIYRIWKSLVASSLLPVASKFTVLTFLVTNHEPLVTGFTNPVDPVDPV